MKPIQFNSKSRGHLVLIPTGEAFAPPATTVVPWVPADLLGYLFDFDARATFSDTAGHTPSTSGNPILSYTDLATSGLIVQAQTSTECLSYEANQINGLPGAFGTGSAGGGNNAWLSGPSTFPVGASYTKIIIARQTANQNLSNLLSGGSSGGTGHAQWTGTSGDDAVTEYHGTDVSPSPIFDDTAAAWFVAVSVVTSLNNGANHEDHAALYFNGQLSVHSDYLWAGEQNTSDQISVGAYSVSGVGGDCWNGSIARAIVLNQPMPAGNWNNLAGYLNGLYGLALPTFARSVPCHGDSITTGLGASPAYVAVSAAAHAGCWFLNLGCSGNTLTEGITQAPTWVDPLLVPGAENVLVFFMGTNDLINLSLTAAELWSLVVSYTLDRQAAGWLKIIFVNVLPRTGMNETIREAFNALSQANAAAIGLILADVTTLAMGASGANLNGTYYQVDGTHPTVVGQAQLAGLIGPLANAA